MASPLPAGRLRPARLRPGPLSLGPLRPARLSLVPLSLVLLSLDPLRLDPLRRGTRPLGTRRLGTRRLGTRRLGTRRPGTHRPGTRRLVPPPQRGLRAPQRHKRLLALVCRRQQSARRQGGAAGHQGHPAPRRPGSSLLIRDPALATRLARPDGRPGRATAYKRPLPALGPARAGKRWRESWRSSAGCSSWWPVPFRT